MQLVNDLKVLYHLIFKPVSGHSHEERLESFYSGQASGYDSFRERLLKGRQELLDDCLQGVVVGQGESTKAPIDPASAVWLDFGGGTGRNLAYSEGLRRSFKEVLVVDLSRSLLKQADARAKALGWNNVRTVYGDVTKISRSDLSLDQESVALITFSYSLTMIPDWFQAVDHALSLLSPGGSLGVVDFYVSRKYPTADRITHTWFNRTFWPTWFGFDNVYLSGDHLPYLCSRLEAVKIREERASVPYLPFVRVPYYSFFGRKADGYVSQADASSSGHSR